MESDDISISFDLFSSLEKITESNWFWLLHLSESECGNNSILSCDWHTISHCTKWGEVDVASEYFIDILTFHSYKNSME